MRPDLDTVFMDTAYTFARRATCDRKHVGCVLTRDGHLLATGYNGSPEKQPHCDEAGHLMDERYGNRCVRTAHAEANAIATAAKYGRATNGATAYITCTPCYDCAKLLIRAGIVRVIFHEHYRGDGSAEKLLEASGVEVIQFHRYAAPMMQS